MADERQIRSRDSLLPRRTDRSGVRADSQLKGRPLEGAVLCRIGDHRLAMLAAEVSAIAEGETGAPYAGRPFADLGPAWHPAAFAAEAPPGARLLRCDRGDLLVDTIEVHSTALVMMAVPAVLAAVMGGALEGFVVIEGDLWPVVSPRRFTTFVEGFAPASVADPTAAPSGQADEQRSPTKKGGSS